jgi:hypothetical protein
MLLLSTLTVAVLVMCALEFEYQLAPPRLALVGLNRI